MQIIEDKLYGVKFRVYYNYSQRSLAKEFKKIGIDPKEYKLDDYDGLHLHTSNKTDANVHIIWVSSKCMDKPYALLHELLHAIITIWDVHGLDMQADQEAFTYYVTYILKQINTKGGRK